MGKIERNERVPLAFIDAGARACCASCSSPKPLLAQWRPDLYQLFNIDAVEAEPRIGGFDGEGVFLIGA